MRLVETAALEVELEEDGPTDGPPVLLLHGWPAATRGWRPVASRLHESGWRTLAPSLRGSGATRFRSPEAPRDGRGVALAAYAADRDATLMIQGAGDRCDRPAASSRQERFFTGGYRRVLLDGVGHFPHREAPDDVAASIDRHLRATAARS